MATTALRGPNRPAYATYEFTESRPRFSVSVVFLKEKRLYGSLTSHIDH